jgi:predicted nucleotidyltransferase
VTGPHEVPREAKAAIERFVAAVRQVFGASLRSVILYGSAASGEYLPGRSDLNFALVLDEISLDALARCRPFLKVWRKDGIALPLFLTPEDIRRSADIFPVEYLDICEHHLLLAGDDFFADLQIDQRNLRFQIEHELKAKLLALRQAYLAGLDRGRPEAVAEELLGTSLPAFLALGRNLLRVAGQRPPSKKAETPAALEQTFGLSLPTFADLVARRARGERLEAGEGVARLARYLGELDAVARVVDGLADSPAWRTGRGAGGAERSE